MSSEAGGPAIRAAALAKRYRIGTRSPYRSLREELTHRLLRPWARRPRAEIWALRDVSFTVDHGEVVGVIGRNGAGKSTLLKVLARITEPTSGRAELLGRVACLLEVGTGFHPELTGRENIYLSGAISGMRRREIDAKLESIVEFAEVGPFLETPVKRYSSGMYLRLAFAIAAHLEPDILLVDEVLAVGDAGFQKKCIGRMSEVASSGRAVLFVSHNMGAVAELCTRALLLDSGRITFDGSARDAVERYLSVAAPEATIDLAALPHRGVQGHAVLQRLELLDGAGRPSTSFVMGQPFVARITLECRRRLRDAEVGLKISSRLGVAIHYLTSTWEGLRGDLAPGRYTFEVRVPSLLLFPGHYQVGLWVLREGDPADDSAQEVTTFEMIKGDVTGHSTSIDRYSFSGCEVYVPCQWRVLDAVAAGRT
jgi:lipopolysaccharide transport system ATP-binding protein